MVAQLGVILFDLLSDEQASFSVNDIAFFVGLFLAFLHELLKVHRRLI